MDGLMGVIPTMLGGAILIGATALILDKTLDKSFSMEKPKPFSVLEEAGV
jgi:hypothetical protein